MRRKIFATLVMTLLAAALFAVPSFAVGSGELARDIVLTDMSGKQVSLDGFKGKTVVPAVPRRDAGVRRAR